MKLTQTAQEIMGSADKKGLRTRLALELNFTERWILKCIEDNKPNGPLTTIAASKLIIKETGMKEKEVFENVSETV